MRHDSETLMLPAVNLLMDERRLLAQMASWVSEHLDAPAPARAALPVIVARTLADALGAISRAGGGFVIIPPSVFRLTCPDASDRERERWGRRAAWWRRRADRASDQHLAAWARREKRERRRLVQAARDP